VANEDGPARVRQEGAAPPTTTPEPEAERPGTGGAAQVGLTRRSFVRGGSAVGVGAAVLWSGPAIRSIRLAANAGSPMPTATTVPVVGEGITTPVPEKRPAAVHPPKKAPARSDPEKTGTLPLTGAEIGKTTAVGVSAIVAGRALMSARPRTRES
jgi:hypothetical protein